jgi:hypothetical protein
MDAYSRRLFAWTSRPSSSDQHTCYRMHLDPRQCRPEDSVLQGAAGAPLISPSRPHGAGLRREMTSRTSWPTSSSTTSCSSKLEGDARPEIVEQPLVLVQLHVLQYVDNAQTAEGPHEG